jgi:hypothetical protein
MSFKRILISWFDIHGVCHMRSRRVSVKRMIGMGV